MVPCSVGVLSFLVCWLLLDLANEDTCRRLGRRRGQRPEFLPPLSGFSLVSGSGCTFLGGSAHIWALGTPPPPSCLQTQGGSSFPLQLIPGWPPCLPGALSAVRPRPVPAPNSRRGCCLPVWTLQKQWPFCYSHGPFHSLFLLSLARIQNAPTLFTRTSLPSSGLASPEPPWLQIPGQAVPLHGKHRAGAGARGARSRLTSPSRSAERSLLTLIQPPGLRGRVVASRFPAWQISLLLDNSDIGCQYLIRLKSPWRAVDSSRAWHWALCAVYLARALFSLSKPSPLQRAPEAL